MYIMVRLCMQTLGLVSCSVSGDISQEAFPVLSPLSYMLYFYIQCSEKCRCLVWKRLIHIVIFTLNLGETSLWFFKYLSNMGVPTKKAPTARNCNNTAQYNITMTSSNGNIFCITGPVCGKFTGHGWIPTTKSSDAIMFSLICTLNKRVE